MSKTKKQKQAEDRAAMSDDSKIISPFSDLKFDFPPEVLNPPPPPPPPKPTKADLQKADLSKDDKALLEAFGGDDAASISLERADTKKHREKVQLRREKKGHGGKEVTVVTGLELMDTLKQMELCAALKTSLGIGGRFFDGILELQGDQRTRASQWFEKHGYETRIL